MRLVPASLGGRLLLGASALIVVALLGTGFAMDLALRRFIQGQVDGRLDGQILAVTDALRAGPDGTLRLEREVDGPPFDRPRSGWFWQVLAPAPVLASRSFAGVSPMLDDGAPDTQKPVTENPVMSPAEPLRIRARRFRFGDRTITVLAAAPRRALAGPLREAMTPLALTLAGLALALIGGVLLQVRLGLRPLAALRADLASVRGGRAERIEGPQPREVMPLVADLNTLLDQNAANLERARRHVANLAHGLKTPLATLALALDEPAMDPARRLRPLVATMDRLIRHHLARARAAALGGSARARVTLAPTFADHLAVFAKLYAEKGIVADLAVAAEIAVACEAQDLDEMIGNLLDNAFKWGRSRVALEAVDSGPRVMVTIEDDGPGLSPAQADDVVRPGRRADEAMPGHGFGLPIARELAELYGGGLALTPSSLGGLKAVLDLPRAG